MAAGGLLLIVFGFLLLWVAFSAVDWSSNPSPQEIVRDLYDAIPG